MVSVLTRHLVVVQAVAAKLDLPEDLIGYFSLFLIRESVDGAVTCESHHHGNVLHSLFSSLHHQEV